ncbi:MAG: ATP-binding protein [Runella slithyformis]|nr:MAG: ATP-binding protein [Runella slithyformis]TAF27532.1 MAG: ATP-binding protein [Runella slithyformis]TAF82228.1 MAG: ATP-binding protein [Runella slithyformis]
MIQRHQKDQIQALLTYFPVVGIVGARQVGKTTLAKEIAEQLTKPSVYLDLELPSTYEQLAAQPEWFLSQYIHKTVIIDEVQLMLNLFPMLRSLIDQQREAGRFILLGSASPVFLAKSSETLAGRIAFEVLSPFSWAELAGQDIMPSAHWFRGGYPSAILAPNDSLWWHWQQNFVKSYIERDLGILGINESPILLYRVLKMVANLHGSLLNVSDLSKSLQIDQRKVKKYLDILEQAYLIRSLPPWHTNIPKRLVKSPKVYFKDSGNLHYLLDLNSYELLVQHPMVGSSWEGYIIEQICNQLADGVMPYFYRTSHGAEIDLVLVRGITPVVAIEIKLSVANALSKGNTEAIADMGTVHNFVITTEGGDYMIRPQWRVCNLVEILSHLNKLGLVKP